MSSERLGAGRLIQAAAIPEATVTTALELATADGATVSGILRVTPGSPTVAVLMHPRQDFSNHVLVPELLSRGYSVWTQGTRSVGNDLRLLHEEAILDLAAGLTYLRDKGLESAVLIGHSGGAALCSFYIEQSSLAPSDRIAISPGGRPVPLASANMPTVDGLILMAPHPGQGELLLRLIDPSVSDESDPMSIDRTLDPYDPENGFRQPPTSASYSAEFVTSYRAAQRARIERIDDKARQLLASTAHARARYSSSADARDRRASLASGVIVVYRTDADLRCVDLSMDRNDRPYGSLFGRRPDLTNYGVVGFCRVTTPEAWLSTWSATTSNASMLRCARGVTVPVLLIELTGDQACFPADAENFVAAFPHEDVKHVRLPGLHFGAPLAKDMPTGAALAGAAMGDWLAERFGTE